MRVEHRAIAVVALSLLLPAATEAAQDLRAFPEHPAPCTILEPPGDGNYATNLWPDGVVPYAFDDNVSFTNQNRSRDAMDEIEAVAAITFVPRTTETSYVFIRASNANNSFVGRQGGAQTINIVSWTWEFIIVHELLHALGTWHEHQRPDREQFIQIDWDNITPQFQFAFQIRQGTMTGPYDFDSVMHYDQCAFATCCSASCHAITVLPPNESWQFQIGQRDHLSDGDIDGLVAMYGLPCAMDLDYSGEVGFGDLLEVIAAWGPCSNCPEDVSGNGEVNFGDLLLVMSEWGACE